MKHNKSSPLGLYTIGIAALFLAGFFLLVVFGAQSYRNTVAGQNDNMQTRALLSYLATTVKGYDSRGAVSVREDPAVGKILQLEDGSSGYALRIYHQDGVLLEDYAADGEALRPEDAQTIGRTALFEPELAPEGLLRIRTDAGQVLLQLRTGDGAGAGEARP
ncbi:MAG: DUF4860 domain-containing protein [Oscillospiraceae bacterium]|nr:DUF4860 domain-containing protein [Oscillospiraceae bacterium]